MRGGGVQLCRGDVRVARPNEAGTSEPAEEEQRGPRARADAAVPPTLPALAAGGQRRHGLEGLVRRPLQGSVGIPGELRADGSVPRITYLEGRIEMMTLCIQHGILASKIGCLVEVWCLERGIEFNPVGSWTIEKKEAERGAEPDECYAFGDPEAPARPDLAIEVEGSRRAINKLEVYRKLDVPEAWIWGKGHITPSVLRGERYEALGHGEALPGLDLEHLASFLERHPTSQAIREYRAALATR